MDLACLQHTLTAAELEQFERDGNFVRTFREAHRLLSQDAWLVDNEAERLTRILKLSQPQ